MPSEIQQHAARHYEEVLLERMRVAVSRRIRIDPSQIMFHFQLMAEELDMMAVDLVAHIAGRKREHVEIFSTYRSWWDHFKASFFPKWLLLRFPPKMKETHVTLLLAQYFPDVVFPDDRAQYIQVLRCRREVKP